MAITVPLASAAQYLTSPAQNVVNYVSMYMRQVLQSVASGNQTAAEQQISMVEQKIRSGDAMTDLGGPRLSSVQQYVGQVAAHIRAGDLASAEQALITSNQYSARVVSSAK